MSGTGWGNQGFAWLSYEFIQAFASDIYTMQSRSNYQPTSFARFKLFHPFWGWNFDDVTVTIGVGNETNSLWSKSHPNPLGTRCFDGGYGG